jgi:hypothetical protein
VPGHQQALHLAVHRQQRALALGHLHLQHAGQSGHAALAQLGLRQSRHQCGGQFSACLQVHHLHAHIHQAFPIQTAGARGQDLDQHTVFAAQAHFGFRQAHLHKLGRHHGGLLRHQVLGQAVGEGGLFEGEGLHAQLVGARKQPVGAAAQHAVKAAIAQQQGAFVFLRPWFALERGGIPTSPVSTVSGGAACHPPTGKARAVTPAGRAYAPTPLL